MGSTPSANNDPRAFADFGFDVEVAGQPSGAGESEPEAGTCRVAVLHRELDVRDTGTGILKRQAQAAPRRFLDALDDHGAAPAVLKRVSRQLAGGRDDLRLIDEVEAELDGALAHELTYDDDIFGRPDLVLARRDRHAYAPACGCPIEADPCRA